MYNNSYRSGILLAFQAVNISLRNLNYFIFTF